MNTPNDIDYRKIDSDDLKKEDFPAIFAEEFRVHIDPQAYKDMKDHVITTDEVELCGVLIGDVYHDQQGAYLKVVGAIEGKQAGNFGTQVTFTHDTWNHINQEKDAKYPQEKIVGWYHTHPGFGVFLSEMDMFIQQNFFNQPYQVAIVFETKKEEEGCFAWSEGKSQPLKYYWVGDEKVELVGGEKQTTKPPVENLPQIPEAKESVRDKLPSIATMILFLLCGFLLAQTLLFRNFQHLAAETFESEFYSVVEYSALSHLIEEDLNDINKKLQELSQNTQDAKAQQSVQTLTELIKNQQKVYKKRRSKMRRQIEFVLSKRQTLEEKILQNRTQQHFLQETVSNLYMLRIYEMIKLYKKDNNAVNIPILKKYIHEVLKLDPRNIQQLKSLAPKLIDSLFPQLQKKNNKES